MNLTSLCSEHLFSKLIGLKGEPLLIDPLEHLNVQDHLIDWIRVDLDNQLAIIFRHSGMCLSCNNIL